MASNKRGAHEMFQEIDFEWDDELIGDWIEAENKEYKYEPAPNGKFVAQYNGNTIVVFQSKWAVKCLRCSPCYPRCGDVDSRGESVIAYILPPEYLNEEWLKKNKDRIIELEKEGEK